MACSKSVDVICLVIPAQLFVGSRLSSVAPDSKLSYQYHHKRQEQWTIIKGNLTIILDDEKVFRAPGESIKIPLGARHRAWNETDELVQFIEVQTGTYFGEDDIVRIEDDYNRN